MKKTRCFIAMIMLFCMCVCMTTTAFAATGADNTELGVMNTKFGFEVPDDAVILYEDEQVCFYQSESKTTQDELSVNPRVDDNYGYAWVNSSSISYFHVNCTLTGTVQGTFKVESSSSQSSAQMTISGPAAQVPSSITVAPWSGDVYFTLKGCTAGRYTVSYIATTTVGMRLMCWLYK